MGKIAEQIQIDLIDMRKYSKHNEGYNWIISMIDIFSRYAFTIAVKNKSGKDVLNGFVKLMKQFHEKFKRYPKRVQADEGKGFSNINFNEYLKAAVVEGFNRTLKNFMSTFMDEKGDKNWVEYLKDFTFNYNNSVNESNYDEVFGNLYEKWTGLVVPPKFKIGD